MEFDKNNFSPKCEIISQDFFLSIISRRILVQFHGEAENLSYEKHQKKSQIQKKIYLLAYDIYLQYFEGLFFLF